MPLRRYPEFCSAIGVHRRQAGMGLNVTLVGLFGLIGLFNDHIGFGKACFNVAMTHLRTSSNVGGLGWLRLNASRDDAIMNHRRRFAHGFIDIGNVGKLLVLHVDQLQSLSSCLLVYCGNRCHRVSVIQRTPAGHAVFQDIRQTLIPASNIRQIGAGDNGFHTGQFFCLAGVDFDDARVRMWRTQYPSD